MKFRDICINFSGVLYIICDTYGVHEYFVGVRVPTFHTFNTFSLEGDIIELFVLGGLALDMKVALISRAVQDSRRHFMPIEMK